MEAISKLGSKNTYSELELTSDLFSRWIKFVDVKEQTAKTYKAAIKNFAKFLLEHNISQPTREDILSYKSFLKQSYKPATAQTYLIAVKLFFQWTQQEGWYPNIAIKVKSIKIGSEHKKDYLTTNQINKVINDIPTSNIKGLRDAAILTLMVTGGLRTIEVSRANIEDMRPVGGNMVLYVQGKGKDEKTDYVKISQHTEIAIRKYLSARQHYNQNDPLFASVSNRNSSGRMTTKSISRIVKDSFNNTGLNSERLTAHSLRHTAATLNLLNGGSIAETQQLLRHSNINTTMIYNHALERAGNNSEFRIDNAIFEKIVDKQNNLS